MPLIFLGIDANNNPEGSKPSGLIVFSVLVGASVTVLLLVYEVLLPYIWNGQTFGMRLFRVKMVDEKREPLKLRQILIHGVVIVIVAILTVGISILIELLIVLLSKEKRGFCDTISRIYFVNTSNEIVGYKGEN